MTRPPKENRDSLQRGDECSLLSTNLPSPNIDTTESTPHIWQPWEPEDVVRSPKEELQSTRETDVSVQSQGNKERARNISRKGPQKIFQSRSPPEDPPLWGGDGHRNGHLGGGGSGVHYDEVIPWL